jgi:S-DNA-T family DNA segregation ATPase FtsK/SpoIIIE
MVKMARSGAKTTVQPDTFADRRTQDICGLILFFLGTASLLCLALPQQKIVPVLVNNGLRLLAGTGAYAVSLLLMFAGTMFLIGYERLSFSRASCGTLLLFLDVITGRHLELLRQLDARHLPPDGYLGQVQVLIPQAGGWIGWLFGSPLHYLLDRPLSYLFLLLIALIAVVLIVDQPFIEILRRIHAQSRAGAQAAGRSLQQGKALLEEEKRRRGGEERGGAKIAGAMSHASAVVSAQNLAAEDVAQDRALRAARVAERALMPAGRSAANAPADLPADAHPATESKTPNLFNLTRLWRGEQETDRETGRPGDRETQAQEALESNVSQKRKAGRTAESPVKAGGDTSKSKTSEAELEVDGNSVSASPALPVSFSEFVLPPVTLLAQAPPTATRRAQNELTDNVSTIERTLEQFNIGANVVEVSSGPSVTRYEIQLAPGIKVSKIVSLADNLAMSLAAIDVRVEAPIPGKSAIGVEVPNATPVMVTLRECLETDEFKSATSKLTIALGKDVSGQYKYADLTKMPHLLIGGSTNSGKSVCLNVLIASLVYRNTPRDVRMLMIDPKRVELSLWDGIPHLMHPVVKDVKQAAGIFRAALREMDRRYDLFATLGTRNLDGYNQRVPDTERLPYIVLIVDELADLMMQQGPEVETSICRLAQLARATGIHLVIATQRPSVDIITGTIKANISSRIAFAVASQVDSRTILDMTGADRLIGKGDMLFMPIDASKPLRIQGCYLSENETNAIVDYLKEQEKPVFTFSVAEGSSSGANGGVSGGSASEEEGEGDDQFFEQAVRLVVNNGQASTSMLQRRFRIGYTRAARIVEMMEEKGIVGPLNGAKPRELLVSKDDVERMFNPGSSLPSVDDYQDEE